MSTVTLYNMSYQKIIDLDWKHAVVLIINNKVSPCADEYMDIRTGSGIFKLPLHIILKKYVHMTPQTFSYTMIGLSTAVLVFFIAYKDDDTPNSDDKPSNSDDKPSKSDNELPQDKTEQSIENALQAYPQQEHPYKEFHLHHKT